MSASGGIPALDGPLLVIAPHPDDETLGCGGVIALATCRNVRVHTVFVTDGGASHPNSAEWSRERLAERREREAEEALRRLGAGEEPRTFLRLKDAAMPARGSPAHARAAAAMAAIVRDLSPGLALLPWRRDPHRDHRDSWQLAMNAIAAAGRSPEILEYAIWLDEFGQPGDRPRVGEMEEVRIDVSAGLEAKRHAIEAHESQLGGLVIDDPTGFVLGPATIARLTGRWETFWRPCGAR